MAADVVGLMDALGVGRAHICGASMGGMIAQELTLRHPDHVRTLQLHCTAPTIDAYGRFWMDTLLAVNTVKVWPTVGVKPVTNAAVRVPPRLAVPDTCS